MAMAQAAKLRTTRLVVAKVVGINVGGEVVQRANRAPSIER